LRGFGNTRAVSEKTRAVALLRPSGGAANSRRRPRRFALKAQPNHGADGNQQQRDGSPIQQHPAEMLMQVAGQEAGRSGGAENQEVIQGLGLDALIRAIGGGDKIGRPDQREIQARAIQRERRAEMPLMASQRGSSLCILD
jgi:hypothetical protein